MCDKSSLEMPMGTLNKLTKKTFVLFIALATGILLTGCNSGNEKEQTIAANFNMELENSKGERLSMEEFKGKKIFFNVWATWCAPCIEEMPTIHNLYKEVGDGEVAFLMLSMDQDFEKAKAFRDRYGYDFEIYRPVNAIPAMYHTKKIPTTFVISSEGNLVLQHDGMGEFDTEAFKNFLAGVK